jgi:hypothetical protein
MASDFIHKIKPLLWQILFLTISAALFSLILINRSPNLLRPISMSLRTGFGLVIPLTALILYLAFRVPNRLGDLVSMAATLSLFAMPLAGLWASGQTQSVAINGLIPLTDAANYYNDSLRILAGRDISHFSAMRPFFPGFLSFLMSMADQNYMASLAVITLIAAIAIYLGIREIQRTHGAETAVFLLVIVLLYFRHHSGTSMSETLGAPFGVLGMGLIWRGLEKRSQNLAIFGLFITALALTIRPGAMFTLPLILVWTGWTLRKNNEFISIRFLILGAAAIVISFMLNFLFIRLLADPSGTAFSNFSWALYGLASGGHSFNYVFQQHPEVLLLKDPEQSRAIYRLALDLIIHDPGLFVKGVSHNWSMFFSDSWYSAFSFLEGENGSIYRITRWTIYILCVLGLIKWMRKLNDPYSGLVAMSAIGVLLSVPFVPPTDAYRVRLYAASIVIFGLLPAMGVSLLVSQIKLKWVSLPNPQVQDSNVTAVFGTLLVVLVLGGTLLVKATSQQPPALAVNCPPGEDKIAIQFNAGASINILREKSVFLDWMPNFHQGQFRRSIHSLADMNLIQYLEAIPADTSIFSSFDYLSDRRALVIMPTSLLPQPGTYIGICGHWEADPKLKIYDVFFTREVIRLIED